MEENNASINGMADGGLLKSAKINRK